MIASKFEIPVPVQFLSRAVPDQFQASSRRILSDPGGSCPVPIHFQAGLLPELKHDYRGKDIK
jgi:hypothetical protein